MSETYQYIAFPHKMINGWRLESIKLLKISLKEKKMGITFWIHILGQLYDVKSKSVDEMEKESKNNWYIID